MSTSRTKTLALAAAVLGCTAALPSLATAAPAPGNAAPSDIRPVKQVDVTQDATAVAAYWTPERMAAATPAPEPKRSSGSASVDGPEVVVSPTPAKGASDRSPAGLAPAAVPELTLYERPYSSAAEKSSGKVFYTTASGGNNNCSAGTISAGNKSLVWTAAHCVGAGYTNIAYVPAYNSGDTGGGSGGDAPYGVWPAREFFPGTYPDNDHTAIVVSQVGGRYLQDVVGAQGARFNADLSSETVTIIGYPAARIYDGSDMTYCTNTVSGFDPTGRVAVECDTEGGSSGGPYVVDNADAGSLGSQVATHSQGGGINAYGDPFDSLARAIYDQAQVS